ncbi:MAG: NAD(P)H-dependent flavin oxidoreductase [Eubacteriales bacterium]
MKLPALHIGDLTAPLPIIQGGMGVGISLSGLAGAVAREGGIGILSGVQIGYREADFARNPVAANLRAIGQEIRKAREIAPKGIIGINFMTVMNHYEEYVREAVKNGIDLIISGAGLPLQLARLVKDSSVKIMPIVSSARACKLILRSWLREGRLPDGVVVEGPLAGGHLGFKYQDMINNTFASLESCFQEVRDFLRGVEEEHHVTIPVIAAGGISTHQDICRFMEMGAAGVQMGTRFVATEECDASDYFKQTYLSAREEDIRIIKSPVGLAARAIQNDFLEEAYQEGGIRPKHCYGCLTTCDPATTQYCISQALIDSARGQKGLVFTGAHSPGLHEIIPVSQLMHELAPDN